MPATFLHYKDDHGNDVVVDDIKQVPEAMRARVKVLDGRSTEVRAAPESQAALVQKSVQVDWPSFAMGAGSGSAIALLVALVLGRSARAMRFVLMACVIACVAVGYLSFVRKQAGLSGGNLLATPQTIVQDARDAAKVMEDRAKAQQKALEEAEAIK